MRPGKAGLNEFYNKTDADASHNNHQNNFGNGTQDIGIQDKREYAKNGIYCQQG